MEPLIIQTALGIDPVISDEEGAIVETVNALRRRYTYVHRRGVVQNIVTFTDVCVTKSFGAPIDSDPRALAQLARVAEGDWCRDDLRSRASKCGSAISP